MTVFTSVIILLLSMLITASLQLAPGTFSLFYHYALGKTTAKKTDDRSLSFILGAEIFTGLIWALLLIIFSSLCPIIDFYSSLTFWVLFGIFIAEAIAFALFYFRRGRHTALFIPRRIATELQTYSRKAKTRSDAIAVGFFANFPELIFTLPLYFISTIIILNTPALPRAPIIAFYIIFTTLPLFIIRILYRSGHNLAHITKFRVKLKPYLRIIVPIAYILLALAILNLGIINHG